MRDLFSGKNAARWLLVSVLVNMFLLGVAVAPHFFRPAPPPPLTPPPPRFMIERLSESLSDAGRHELLQAYDETEAQLNALFEAFNGTQRDLMRIFAADSLDEAAYRQALDNRKAAADKFFSAMSDFFLRTAGKLSADDRRRIAERGRI